eukprot:3409705-Rhodomonas_salina.2
MPEMTQGGRIEFLPRPRMIDANGVYSLQVSPSLKELRLLHTFGRPAPIWGKASLVSGGATPPRRLH